MLNHSSSMMTTNVSKCKHCNDTLQQLPPYFYTSFLHRDMHLDYQHIKHKNIHHYAWSKKAFNFNYCNAGGATHCIAIIFQSLIFHCITLWWTNVSRSSTQNIFCILPPRNYSVELCPSCFIVAAHYVRKKKRGK